MRTRVYALLTVFILMAGSITGGQVAAQGSPLDELAEGPLQNQVRWFVDLLNSGGSDATEEVVASHFSPDFLEQVPPDEVLTTVAQLQPVLGEITVERIASGSTDTDAGVILAGETGVRVRVTLWIEPDTGLIAGLLIEPPTSEPPAATPWASPTASPVASPVAAAPEMETVVPAFEAAQEEIAAPGRAVVEALLAGDNDALVATLAPGIEDAFGIRPASDTMQVLTTNRVHFEVPGVGAIFDGHLRGDRISGFFYQLGPGIFELTAEEPQDSNVPTGTWTGFFGSRAGGVGISVTFTGEADALAATLDIPDQGMTGQPLTNVSFLAEQPLGELSTERVLPLGGPTGNNVYSAAYAWGDALVAFTVGMDGVGRVHSLQPVAYWPLPADPAVDIAPIEARLPFDGTWLVSWGGDTELLNYHASTPAQRHAYDLMVWQYGATYRGDGTANEQYYAWGQPIAAPVDGTVVSAWNNQVDLLPNQITDPDLSQEISPLTHPGGNHVVIETAEGQFIVIAHMQEGTVRVDAGDEVRVGDVIGLVGNSGNSSEPHIHIHAQDRKDMLDPQAVGLPLGFVRYVANGEPVELGVPVQAQLIAPAK